MINSKALRNPPKRWLTADCGCPEGDEHTHSALDKALRTVARFFVFKIYYPVESFFGAFFRRSKRSLAWARFTHSNYDFDFTYLYAVMSFKAKRIYTALENDYAIQAKEDMKALKEFIRVCDRLHKNNYDDKHHVAHDKKWGKRPPFGWKPAFDKDGKEIGSEIISKPRPKAKNKRLEEQERKEFLACYDLSEVDRKNDIDRMAELLKNYSLKWWS